MTIFQEFCEFVNFPNFPEVKTKDSYFSEDLKEIIFHIKMSSVEYSQRSKLIHPAFLLSDHMFKQIERCLWLTFLGEGADPEEG